MQDTTTAETTKPKLGMRDLWNELGEEKIKALSQAFYDRVYGTVTPVGVYIECSSFWNTDLFAR